MPKTESRVGNDQVAIVPLQALQINPTIKLNASKNQLQNGQPIQADNLNQAIQNASHLQRLASQFNSQMNNQYWRNTGGGAAAGTQGQSSGSNSQQQHHSNDSNQNQNR